MSGMDDKAAEWLLREIHEDHAFATACLGRPILGSDMDAIAERVARCEAELAILDFHRTVLYPSMGHMCDACSQPAPCKTVRLLASGYRHRAAYAEMMMKASKS